MGIFLTFLVFAFFTILGELLRPKPDIEDAKPAGLGDFQFPTATEKRKVPIVWGTVQMKGPNVVWYGDLRQVPIKEKIKTGLFSSTTVVKGYRYFVGVQFALCRGPIDSLRRAWIGEDIILDAMADPVEGGETFEVNDPNLFGGDDLGTGGFSGTFEFFNGARDQAASSYLFDFQEINGQSCAFRGTAYVAPFEEAPYVGNSTTISPPKFEVVRIAEANPLGLFDPSVNTDDANPANALLEALTDSEWGMGIDPADIDATSFEDAAATLASEGNGFSFLWDRAEDVERLIQRIESQIDGVLFKDLSTGLYRVKLARDDYAIGSIPAIDDESIVRIERYSQGTFEDTTNVFTASFTDRDDDYKETFALAQDMANVRIQDGRIVHGSEALSGVKVGALANSIAWRELRTLAYPLIQARIIVDRTQYQREPMEVVALSFVRGAITVDTLPMRVKSIDYGNLEDGEIALELVQDVFRSGVGSFGDPPGSDWVEPGGDIPPFAADEQIAFEAPRALVARDITSQSPSTPKVFATARTDGVEAGFRIYARSSNFAPTGDFIQVGSSVTLAYLGELRDALSIGDAVPRASDVVVVTAPDTEGSMISAFENNLPLEEIGASLSTLCLIGDEFVLPVSLANAVADDGEVELGDVYRGVLDSVQKEHAAGTPVWLVFAGGALTGASFDPEFNVDIHLEPAAFNGSGDQANATEIAFTMDRRVQRPYCPSDVQLNGTAWPTSTISLEGGGTGEEDGIEVAFTRRDFDAENEVAALQVDAGEIDGSYPAKNSTTHSAVITDDPDGAADVLFTYDFGAEGSGEIPRLEILRETDGVIPSRMRIELKSTHLFEGDSLDSRETLTWDFDVSSSLSGGFNFGARDSFAWSEIYTATVGGTYSFTLSSAFPNQNVRYRINGSGETTMIAAGATFGNITGVGIGDTIEIRHTNLTAGELKLITMNAPGAGQDGYGVLYV